MLWSDSTNSTEGRGAFGPFLLILGLESPSPAPQSSLLRTSTTSTERRRDKRRTPRAFFRKLQTGDSAAKPLQPQSPRKGRGGQRWQRGTDCLPVAKETRPRSCSRGPRCKAGRERVAPAARSRRDGRSPTGLTCQVPAS